MANADTPEQGSKTPASGIDIEGEPDLTSGSLEEWLRYRQSLNALPRDDENVRLAIAVADARIAKLRLASRHPRKNSDYGR